MEFSSHGRAPFGPWTFHGFPLSVFLSKPFPSGMPVELNRRTSFVVLLTYQEQVLSFNHIKRRF